MAPSTQSAPTTTTTISSTITSTTTTIASTHTRKPTASFVVFKRRSSSPSIAALLLLLLNLCSFNLEAHCQTDEQDAQVEIHHLFKPEHCDRKAKRTDVLTLHYNGYIQGSDTIFDSSYERNEPLTFQLGIGQVIRGWEKGLVGVCVGEKRKLVIPPQLGYGNAKHDQVPPGSTLVFDIELLKIADGPTPMLNVFKEIDVDSDGRLTRKEVGDYLEVQLNNQGNGLGDMGSMDDPNRSQMVDEIFMHEDKDKDGYITHNEFSGPKYDHDEL
jgi:FK506-binding protein 14